MHKFLSESTVNIATRFEERSELGETFEADGSGADTGSPFALFEQHEKIKQFDFFNRFNHIFYQYQINPTK